jgi:hypothetical protein
MSRCDRFEREGLLQLEQGRPLDSHFESCPDCKAARETYERLQAQIRALGPADEPRAGWEARVWDAVRRERGRRRWTSARVLVPVGLATAAAVLIAVPLLRGPAPVSLTVDVVVGGGAIRRGIEAHPGDGLRLEARTGGARHVELRVYRNDRELVLRCAEDPPCVHQGDRLKASLTLDARGTYQALVFASKAPLPEPAAGMDHDAGLALASGATVELAQAIQVR